MFRGLLPVGSVVSLESVDAKIMVLGYMPMDLDHPENKYEYSGLVYPLGYQSADQIIMFNADKISAIHFLGLQDHEQMSFEEFLLEKFGYIETDEEAEESKEEDEDNV